MSKVIKNSTLTATVVIGEKQRDVEMEKKAEQTLSSLFPVVSVITDPEGVRYIPIQEVFKIELSFNEKLDRERQEGYQSGRQAGVQEGLKEASRIIQQFDKAIKDTVEQREAILEDARQEVLSLIVNISRKVTFDAIEADPEVTTQIIDGVINTLIDRSRLKIKVNPAHLPIVEQSINRFLTGSALIKEIRVEPDARVAYGGCLIETPTGDVDARLDSQFEVVEDLLRVGEVAE